MKERERRLKEVEEGLRRSLERQQDTGESEQLKQLKTDTEFLRAIQIATKNAIKGRPEKEHYTAEDIVRDPEYNQELKRLLEEKAGNNKPCN